ncbi:hypothetical protein ACU5JM_19615 [Rhodococcus erythropolis]|uniref:hypothetical protein n=1 Tax=Rhodococcus erythropolis TaxID=1833 RepID=UPI00406BA0AF
MPVLRAILHDRYTWEVHAAAVALALLVLLFALIPGVTAIMVLPAALALAAVVLLGFWLSPATYRNRGVADADRPDRIKPDRVGAVQVLDPRLAIGGPAFANGGLIGGPQLIVNDTGRPITIHKPPARGRIALSDYQREVRKLLAPNKDDPYFRRGTPHAAEAVRILGARARLIRTESVRQINGRYLKADEFVIDESGLPVRDEADGLKTKSVRIRIPRDSWLCKDFKHTKA